MCYGKTRKGILGIPSKFTNGIFLNAFVQELEVSHFAVFYLSMELQNEVSDCLNL